MANPTSICKWEDSSGLEHACWACPTKANSPRALHTCYGIHSMPCTSYHPTMHAIGSAHRCSACSTANKTHENRHREIAELVSEYRSITNPLLSTPSRLQPLQERSANLFNRPVNQIPLLTIQDDNAEFGESLDNENDENTAEEDDTISVISSVASTSASTDVSVSKLTQAEKRAQKKAKKSQRSQKKALKNQNRQLATVTTTDVERISQILHGEPKTEINGHPLATDKTIEDVIARNLAFVRNIQNHKAYLYKSIAAGRKENKERKRLKRQEQKGEYENIEMEEIVNAILLQLGIELEISSSSTGLIENATSASANKKRHKRTSSPLITRTAIGTPCTPRAHSNKAQSQIVQKLRDSIKEDLQKHENEVRGIYHRAGGFWRYVGKAVFDRMTEIASRVDVSTGENWEKKKKREAGTKTGETGLAVAAECATV